MATSAQIVKAAAERLSGAVVRRTIAKHTATVIFLHGLGDTGHGWCSILSEYLQPHVKLICPTASTRPVTLNSGMNMPAWFDIYSLVDRTKVDKEGIEIAVEEIHALLEAEMKATGMSSDRIVLGGFSQGGSLAVVSALTFKRPLAGILALSCLVPPIKDEEKLNPHNKEIPFLHCHGDSDMVVSLKWGENASQYFRTFKNSKYEFKVYPGLMHSSSEQEMSDIDSWLQRELPPCGGTK